MITKRTFLVLLIAPMMCFASQDATPPSKLPIDVPKDAMVGFEAEGSGKSFLKVIKNLANGGVLDPSASKSDKVTLKTPLGNIDLTVDDLAPLLEDIHYLHIVTYTDLPKEDPFKHQENLFIKAGLKRVTFVPGSDGVLIMRREAKSEEYGVVVRSKGTVAILRSEGGPGLGDFGQVVFETLTRLVQQSAQAKKHK